MPDILFEEPPVENPWERVLTRRRMARAMWPPVILVAVILVFALVRSMTGWWRGQDLIAKLTLWPLVILPLVAPWSALRLWRLMRRSPLLGDAITTPMPWAEQIGTLRRAFFRLSAAVAVTLILLGLLRFRVALTDLMAGSWTRRSGHLVNGMEVVGWQRPIPFLITELAFAVWSGMLFHQLGILALAAASRAASWLREASAALTMIVIGAGIMVAFSVAAAALDERLSPDNFVITSLFTEDRQFWWYAGWYMRNSPPSLISGLPVLVLLPVATWLQLFLTRWYWWSRTRDVPPAVLLRFHGGG